MAGSYRPAGNRLECRRRESQIKGIEREYPHVAPFPERLVGRRRESQIKGIESIYVMGRSLCACWCVAEENPRLRELKVYLLFCCIADFNWVAEENPRLRELKVAYSSVVITSYLLESQKRIPD